MYLAIGLIVVILALCAFMYRAGAKAHKADVAEDIMEDMNEVRDVHDRIDHDDDYRDSVRERFKK